MGTLLPVLCQFDEQNHVPDCAGIHHAPTSEKGRDAIVRQLQQSGIFSSIRTRVHRTFPQPRDVLHDKSHVELCEWMTDHVR